MSSLAYAPPSSGFTHSRAAADGQRDAVAAPRFAFVDDPVELPLRSRTKGYVMIGAVIAAFIAVLLTVALSGGRVAPSAEPGEPTAPTARPAG